MSAVADIKAIPTEYADRVFRSRTEARWALFFDILRIKWEYEKEAFDLGPGLGSYLPDYWLPQVNMWAEVKPKEFSELELRKVKRLAGLTDFSCILLDGIPDARNYWTVDPDEQDPALGPEMSDIVFSDDYYHIKQGRFYSNTGVGPWEIERQDHQADLKEACQIAKFARFDGEDPWLLVPDRFRRAFDDSATRATLRRSLTR